MISERIKAVMTSVFDTPIADISEESTQNTIEGWTSLNHINLVLALEEEFELSFADEEIPLMTSFEYIVTLLRQQLKG